MIQLLLTIFIAIPCLAVDPDSSLIGNGLTNGPMARYIELHRRINADKACEKLALEEVRAILIEMRLIEQDKTCKLWIKQLHEQLQNYVEEAYRLDLLMRKEDTITDLLLQTFDYASNSCTADYFINMNLLNDIFKQSVITQALRDNRESQYQNCWQRLINTLNASIMIVGLRRLEPLDKLVTFVYPSEIITPVRVNKSTAYQNENKRIAELIARFIRTMETVDGIPDYGRQVDHLVLRTCKLLMDKTKHVMRDIYEMLKFIGCEKYFIKKDQVLKLNRYVLCSRIVSNIDMIRSNSLRLITKLSPKNRANDLDPSSGERCDLITQQLPLDLTVSSLTYPRLEPSPKRTKIAHPISSQPQQVEQIGAESSSQSNRVVKILNAIGRGNTALYPISWSDGSTSLNTKENLEKHWPSVWAKFHRERDNERRRKRRALLKGRPLIQSDCLDNQAQFDLNQVDPGILREINEPLRVMRVCRGSLEGSETKYPTIWSDGSKTSETRDYLESNWVGPWEELMNHLRESSKKKYRTKKARQSDNSNAAP